MEAAGDGKDLARQEFMIGYISRADSKHKYLNLRLLLSLQQQHGWFIPHLQNACGMIVQDYERYAAGIKNI